MHCRRTPILNPYQIRICTRKTRSSIAKPTPPSLVFHEDISLVPRSGCYSLVFLSDPYSSSSMKRTLFISLLPFLVLGFPQSPVALQVPSLLSSRFLLASRRASHFPIKSLLFIFQAPSLLPFCLQLTTHLFFPK